MEQALFAARSIADPDCRALALTVLTRPLPDTERSAVMAEALSAVAAIADGDIRAWRLAALAPHLPAEQLPDALAAAPTQGDTHGYHRVAVLAIMGRAHTLLGRNTRSAYLRLLRTSLQARDRRTCFAILAAATPAIAEIGGAAAIEEGSRAVADARRWWPWSVTVARCRPRRTLRA